MDEHQMINVVASSSEPFSTAPSKKYDIFLSFRGEDTRRNFTCHLHNALKQKKVETYIDYRLEKGDEISPTLIKAIEDSHISVVVFSENYASSKWCLAELNKILECKKAQGQVVIPVFYNINPSHVRKQIGSYKNAFAKHEGEPKCNTWKTALTEVANLAGWDSQTYRTESEFINDIVKDVLRKLTPKYPNQLKGVVGIEENYDQIESLLKIGSSEVRILGIWGMGGIGKSTLATALFLKLSYHGFEGRCFLENVREQSEKVGLNALCNKLFCELLEEENLPINAPFVAPNFVMSRLARKKVFIVLDDVATSGQLENLIIDYDYLGPGSRVIVTTRDKHIFSQVDEIYEVKKLNFPNSLQLFCLNAFGQKHPKEGYEDLSKNAIFYCKGIPLALKVLGASLRSRSKQAWISELGKFQKVPNVEIHKVLKLTYDDLDRSQRDIFLDIACFFEGKTRDQIESLLEPFDFSSASGIDVLLDKALITISNGHVKMHDLIREMGQEIVHQECIKDPGRRSRLWRPKEVLDVLKYNKGTEVVEGITLDSSGVGDLHFSSDSFKGMTSLRYLKVHYEFKYGKSNMYFPDGLESLPDKLRYFLWDGCRLESLPLTFCAEMLVELYMPSSKLRKLWDGAQSLVNLKFIDLQFSQYLVEVPDLSSASNLESIKLGYCESLCGIHPSIFLLPKLVYLCLEGCREIESVKTNVHLKSLCHLNLYSCSSLKEFSVTSEEMTVLDLACTAIGELPSSIWNNRKLAFLALSGCKNLNIVGNKLSNDPVMVSLTDLDLSSCTQLNATNLWFLLDGIRSLTQLDLTNCCNLQALPDNSGNLSSLKYLNLSKTNVKILPTNIKTISMLEDLILDNCMKLISIPELPPSLQVLSALNCISLKTIFNLNVEIINALLYLRKLCLRNCYCLQVLPSCIGLLSSLEELDLSGNNFESLSANIKYHSVLRKIVLDNCKRLRFLPADLPLLPSQLILRALNCTSLDTDTTQKLVLEHMLQSSTAYSCKHFVHDQYAILPGAQVSNKFDFRTKETSITIPYLQESNLCGFMYSIILSKGSFITDEIDVVVCFIYEHGEVVCKDGRYIGNGNLISDHVLFLYHEVNDLYRRGRAYDHYINISFKIGLKDEYKEWSTTDGIKGCGVLPVYAMESRLKLVGNCKEVLESESYAQNSKKYSKLDDDEIQQQRIGTGGFNAENGDSDQLLPIKKRRTSMKNLHMVAPLKIEENRRNLTSVLFA